MTFCYTSAGIGGSFRTHGRTHGGGGRTDRRGSQNSYLDLRNTYKFGHDLFLR